MVWSRSLSSWGWWDSQDSWKGGLLCGRYLDSQDNGLSQSCRSWTCTSLILYCIQISVVLGWFLLFYSDTSQTWQQLEQALPGSCWVPAWLLAIVFMTSSIWVVLRHCSYCCFHVIPSAGTRCWISFAKQDLSVFFMSLIGGWNWRSIWFG